MLRKTRLIPLILIASLLLPALSGCGSDRGSGSQTQSQTDAASDAAQSGLPSDSAGTANSTEPAESSADTAGSSDPTAGEIADLVLEYGDSYALSGDASAADPAIAEISDGLLRAKAVGQTEITVDGRLLRLTVNPAVVDVVLFTGQSNMVGRETSLYKADIPEGQAYEYKYLTSSLTSVQNPVGETFGEVEVSSGSSIVPKFCADYVEQTGRKIVAVHVARGGRSISYFDSRGGLIYQDILEKYGACLDFLENDPNFTVGHRFYVFYQGETDTNNGLASAYKTRFNRFHNGLKSKFDMEFGALIANGRNSDPDNRDGVVQIQQIKAEIAAEKEDVILADVSAYNWYLEGVRDYIRSDLIHLNAEGLQIVAAESCKNILNYMGLGDDPDLAGVDPVTYLTIAEDKPTTEPATQPVTEPATQPTAPTAPSTPSDTQPTAPSEAQERSWTFENGAIDGAERTGTVTPRFENGRYVNDQNNYVRYQLSSPITLSADRDFEIEWSGKAYTGMNNNASILLSGGDTVFLTFQNERGVYLRCGENRFDTSSAIYVGEIYKDHIWRLTYSAKEHLLSVYLDGTLVKTGSWSSDLVFTDLLGCVTGNKYTFVGELDYLKITVGEG